jgi:rubrerythrin
MIRGNEDISEALLNAFRMEKGAQAFYLTASKRMQDQSGVRMFKKLAGMEEKHMRDIYTLYNSFQGDRGPVPFKKFKETMVAEFTESGRKIEAALADVEGRFFVDSREVLQVALAEEKAAQSLYLRLAERSEDPSAASLYRELAEDEMEHMAIIQEVLDQMRG